MQLKQAVGVPAIRRREEHLLARALRRWRGNPAIEILGDTGADRLAIVSFTVRAPSGKLLHHNYLVALLNDLFGIQARGGCSCAGPYGHRLLGIDEQHSHAFQDAIGAGCSGLKPGWVRVNLNYFLIDPVADYLIHAVDLMGTDSWRLLTDYRFDPATGLWRHHTGTATPGLRLTDIRYAVDGAMTYPRDERRAPITALPGYLDDARRILTSAESARRGAGQAPSTGRAGKTCLDQGDPDLSWFELPPECLMAL
jgi:hypothetical protein